MSARHERTMLARDEHRGGGGSRTGHANDGRRPGRSAVQLEVALSLPREARSVAVALSEACTNVLQHGDPAAEYQVRVRLDGERCLLRVVEVVGDLADGAGWEQAGSKLPDGLAERGRGLLVMRSLA